MAKKSRDDDAEESRGFPGGAKIIGYTIPDFNKKQAEVAEIEDFRPLPVFSSEKGMYKNVFSTLAEAREEIKKRYNKNLTN